MAKSERLFALLQALRRYRRPVTAALLASELGVSPRTVYRDMAALGALGAPIEGEAGVGYVLKPGFLLPPLMFDDEELEALMLGLRFVQAQGDATLARAAGDAAAKLRAVLPQDLVAGEADPTLLAGPAGAPAAPMVDLTDLRKAIRAERKLRISYTDAEGRVSTRVIWPIALAFFDRARVLAAWCETRRDFRHFRTDRVVDMEILAERAPRRRTILAKEWRAAIGVAEML